MVSRCLIPSTWRMLPRSERVEMMAYQMHVNAWREKILSDVVEKLPNEFGLLAQALILAVK
jgi:hypothetical protein